MSYQDLLINWCSVYRYTTGTPDAYGQPTVGSSWDVVPTLSDIPCRIEPAKGKEIVIGAEVVIADYKLFLGDVVLSEQDKVYVYWGTIDAWVEYEILLVNDIQNGSDSHHKELFLRTVR